MKHECSFGKINKSHVITAEWVVIKQSDLEHNLISEFFLESIEFVINNHLSQKPILMVEIECNHIINILNSP